MALVTIVSCAMLMTAGDFSHLASIFILLQKMKSSSVRLPSLRGRSVLTFESQSCSGLSFKSQVLYLMVFVTRYLGEPGRFPFLATL